KRRHGWIWLIIFLVLVVVGVIFFLRRHKPKPAPPPPIPISTTNIQLGDIAVSVTALGSVLPVYTVGISPRVDGQLIKVAYTEGQLVKTNDLLAVIDPGPFEALEIEAEGQLARDQAQLDIARIDLKRFQAAYERKAIPEQQLADQQGVVHQDEGTVKFDQGQLANARVQLAYCYIRAPISGRVGLRLVDPGNVVHAANTNAMLAIAQLQPITVLFSVAEDFLPQIQRQVQAGHSMLVEAYDRTESKKIATGEYLTMDNLIDTATGTIRIKATFNNEDFALFPNQFVNARLVIEVLTNQLLIPTFAIQRNPQGAFVYVVTNKVANEVVTTNHNTFTNMVTNEVVTMQNIKVGVSDTNSTAVEGVETGQLIAIDNFNKLGEGVKVKALKPGESPSTNAAPAGPRNSKGKTNAPSK
ncbi:MAG TPA: efflux RND transporter periplasmic adaptor subunit, partial [Verrucomicrobiae bacterium]|nr:efflux RND transporter periplasmic adaptor subunit [Verrucomicrobiae bacterium]